MFITTDRDLASAIDRMRAAGTDLAGYEGKAAAGGREKNRASETTTAVLMNRSHQLEVFHDVQENEIDQAIHHLLKYRRS